MGGAAAVDIEDLPGHVIGFGKKEMNGAGDVFRCAFTPQESVLDDCL